MHANRHRYRHACGVHDIFRTLIHTHERILTFAFRYILKTHRFIASIANNCYSFSRFHTFDASRHSIHDWIVAAWPWYTPLPTGTHTITHTRTHTDRHSNEYAHAHTRNELESIPGAVLFLIRLLLQTNTRFITVVYVCVCRGESKRLFACVSVHF